MNPRAFFLAVVAASLAAVNADVAMIDHDKVEPFAQLEPTTDSEKTALKFKPQLHISYGCHPYPAVSVDGSINAGLKWAGAADGDCKGSDLGSQVYSRSDWYRGNWAIMYAWYFPKGLQYMISLSRQPISSQAIVTTGRTESFGRTAPRLTTRPFSETPPKAKFVVDGTTVKFDSYQSIWGSKQGIQLTEKTGDTQDLITWEQMTKEARAALVDADFDFDAVLSGWSVDMPLSDKDFLFELEDAYPF